MALSYEQLENRNGWRSGKRSGKWMKNQRNRKIRRSDKHEKPNIKYKGYEY
jgi:hypothetical protein